MRAVARDESSNAQHRYRRGYNIVIMYLDIGFELLIFETQYIHGKRRKRRKRYGAYVHYYIT